MILSNVNNTPLRPFEPMVLDCLGEISTAILSSPVGRQFPDLTAFAFYIRKANLQKLASSLSSEEIRLGRGLCFHIAPANIPINFAFTWIFSLLAGNANVVRLPSKDFPQVDALLKRSFRPEFLNRLDEIVFYKPLTKDNIDGIVDLLLADLDKRLADKQLHVAVTREAKDFIIEQGYDPIYGARPLKRYLQSKVETLLARKIVAEDLEPDTLLTVDLQDGKLAVTASHA